MVSPAFWENPSTKFKHCFKPGSNAGEPSLLGCWALLHFSVSEGRAGRLAAMALSLIWSKTEQQAQHLESPHFPRGAHTFPGTDTAVGKLWSAAVVSPPSPNGSVNLKGLVSAFILYFAIVP